MRDARARAVRPAARPGLKVGHSRELTPREVKALQDGRAHDADAAGEGGSARRRSAATGRERAAPGRRGQALGWRAAPDAP